MQNPIIERHRSRRDILRAVGIGGLCFGIAGLQGCAKNPEPVRIGTNLWPGYEPGYLARDLGYFPDQGAKMVQDEAMLPQQSGIEARAILVADISHGADAIIAREGIASMADLRGGRVAVENTALGAFVLTRAMELHGLAPGSIEPVPMTVDESEQIFRSGSADAVVTFEPSRTRLLNAGGRQIFSSREIPNEIVDLLVTRLDYLRDHATSLEAITEGWLRAVEHIERQPANAASRIAPRLDLEPREVLDAFQGLVLPGPEENRLLLGGSEPALLAPARRLADIMMARKLVSSRVSVDSLFTDRVLPRVG
jgi:NitT/TauT family transport system substrate-binding protein